MRKIERNKISNHQNKIFIEYIMADSPWIQHVMKYYKGHPGISYTEALKQAKFTYKKGEAPNPAKSTRGKKGKKARKSVKRRKSGRRR
jgi:transposase